MGEDNRVVFEFAGYRADPLTRRLTSGSEQLPLTPKAFDTLLMLIANRGEVVSKGDLMDAVWDDTAVEENNLTQQIAALRRALGERRGEHRFIVTRPGKGYSFVAPVSELEIAPDDELVLLEATHSTVTIDITNNYSFDWRAFFRRSSVYGSSLALAYTLIVLALAFWPMVTDSPAPPTVAVLAFRTAGPEEEALSVGIRDTLRARLGSLDDVAVRPLSPVVASDDVLIAGRQLDVDVVFTGSIQREADRVRVAVEIVDVRGQRLLWGRTFDYDRSELFELQDAIAIEAVHAIQGSRL